MFYFSGEEEESDPTEVGDNGEEEASEGKITCSSQSHDIMCIVMDGSYFFCFVVSFDILFTTYTDNISLLDRKLTCTVVS